MNHPLLEVRALTKRFPLASGMLRSRGQQIITAVDNVSFDLHPGETLGLVGESGCGKTTTGRMIVRLIEPTAGEVRLRRNGDVTDVLSLRGEQLRQFRRHIQMIFQDPYSSLSPRMRILDIIAEPLRSLGNLKRDEIESRVHALAQNVGLSPDHLRRYPHAFSGGQRQRICIARALALEPDLVVCDEPVSALDVSIRAQIINLLKDLQTERRLSYLFIAHDLSIVENISTRVAVMYAGRIVETASTEALFKRPRHPYTLTLLQAVPDPDPEKRRASLEIVRSSKIDVERSKFIPVGTENVERPTSDFERPTEGCPFYPRCPMAQSRCKSETPAFREITPGHASACHFAEEVPCSAS